MMLAHVNGFIVYGRVARPRLQSLPASGGPPVKILEAASERIGLLFYNDGTGTVYLTDDPAETDVNIMFPIPPGATLSPGIAPAVPQNALYAVGDAGHSLRVWEQIAMKDTGAAPPTPPRKKPWSLLRAIFLLLLLPSVTQAQWFIIPELPPQAGHAGQFLTTNGTVVSWAAAGGGGAIPAGIIVMWSGTLATVPAGWALCDGSPGTPDLRDRFIWGWTAAVNPGGTGGSTSYTPAGTNTAPALTMNSYTPAGTNTAPALTMNSYTPAGTNAVPIFTGSALGTHAHELPMHLPTGDFRHLGNFFGGGTVRAAVTGAGGGLPADTTSAAVALSQAVSAGTPAGSVSAPAFTGTAATLTGTVAAPAFTGTAATIEMPFFKLAFIIKL